MKTTFIIINIFFIHAVALENFTDLQHYIATLPENIKSDNHDWSDPNYSTFHAQLKPSWTDTIMQFLHLKKKPLWNIRNIKKLLDELIATRKPLLEKAPYVINITSKPGAQFVIWGDLFGAAHSLFRDLEYFYEQKIIDDNFSITKPNYYFIFLGDAMDRSPYVLETLHIILTLMQRNPDNVFYLKGKHETNDYWKNFGLKREIEIFLKTNFQEKKRFENTVSLFFKSLPEALYINQKDSTHNVIRLSHGPRNDYTFNEMYLDNFFTKNIGTIDAITLQDQYKSLNPPEVAAIIKGGEHMKPAIITNGLDLLEPDQGATAWSLISCPTQIYQEFFDFYADAFAQLKLGATIDQATIQLFYQDLRNKAGFKQSPVYNLVSGQITDANVTESKPTYTIGSTMALTKGVFFMGQRIKRGISTLINQQNQLGGINGHIIKTIIFDDEYERSLALKNVEILRNRYKIDTLLLPVGSPTLEAYIDLVKSGKITVLFPVTGAPYFRKPELKGIINWRASYADEARALIEHMVGRYAVKKFAFFYQNDAYGLGPLEAAHTLLKEKGITDWVDVPYNRAETDFTSEAEIIKKAQPDAIGFFSIASASEELIRNLGIDTLITRKLFGISFLAENTFRKFLKDRGLEVLFAQVVPNPKTSDLQIVQEFRTLMDENNLPYDIFALEGYICTSLYLEALKNLKDPITPEKLIGYFESLNKFQYKGLELTFNPERRDLTQDVWFEISDALWTKYSATK
ncbi:MAG: ABC transporter substrate-binding protein [Candidatus Babeliaceae bacterium]|jgi:ABC-type branched-subunit amino acid transport system substrate-binding protein